LNDETHRYSSQFYHLLSSRSSVISPLITFYEEMGQIRICYHKVGRKLSALIHSEWQLLALQQLEYLLQLVRLVQEIFGLFLRAKME
jgi:hypothetical protein